MPDLPGTITKEHAFELERLKGRVYNLRDATEGIIEDITMLISAHAPSDLTVAESDEFWSAFYAEFEAAREGDES